MEFNLQIGKTYRHRIWLPGDYLRVLDIVGNNVHVSIYRNDLKVAIESNYQKNQFYGPWDLVVDMDAELELL